MLTLDGSGPLAVVEDGELAEDLALGQDGEELALARNLHFAICKKITEKTMVLMRFDNVCRHNSTDDEQ